MNRHTESHQIFHNIPPYHLSSLALVHSSKDRIGGHSRAFGSRGLEQAVLLSAPLEKYGDNSTGAVKVERPYVELRLFQGDMVVSCV